MVDEIEEGIRAASVRVLRRRAQRQRDRATTWTVRGARGAIIRQGEAAIALRIALALDETAAEIEQGGAP